MSALETVALQCISAHLMQLIEIWLVQTGMPIITVHHVHIDIKQSQRQNACQEQQPICKVAAAALLQAETSPPETAPAHCTKSRSWNH
jgi:hypothetical protein